MTESAQDRDIAVARQMFMTQKKDQTLYLVLALLLGGFGIHHFYLGRATAGVIHLVFCWTLVPAFLALAHAIRYRTAVGDRNREIAHNIAVTMNVPEAELTKLLYL